jgi:hypothetical protein
MKQVNEVQLESDLGYRVQYLMEFMGMDGEDIATIHGAAEHIGPHVNTLVDAVYDKLFSYDATKRHFVPRQHGYEGPIPESVSELTQAHEMIQFRKQHLARYLTILVTKPYDGQMLAYLDLVGKIHTPRAGSRRLHVPLVQMNALMGFVADALTSLVFQLGLEREAEIRTVRAFNKLLWVQNDLINRHYQDEQQAAEAIASPAER